MSSQNQERAQLIENEEIMLEIGSPYGEVEAGWHLKSPTTSPKRSVRRKGLSMTSMCPSMTLSWHGIFAEPKREKGIIPCWPSSIRSYNKESENPKHEDKKILNDVYGVALPGEVLALMGASGAGKTSLLNVLTQRNLSTLHSSGHIQLNGDHISKQALRKISAYVQQEDLFIGTTTVVEHLRFMALMRMGKHYTEEEREQRVQNAMFELGLKHCADTVIGWPHRLKGLSGGERKRLAFASEIMTGPPILLCDEPTSGLDSFLAQQVIQVLKNLAQRKNMTIVVTIHQPSSQVFEMFDKICLLAEGRLAFLGTIDEATTFFNGLGYSLPENFNRADHFISTLAEASKGKQKEAQIRRICDAYTSSELGKRVFEETGGSGASSSESTGQTSDVEEGDEISLAALFKGDTDDKYRKRALQRYKSTWLQQFCALTKRSYFVTIREPMLLKVRLIQTLLIGLLLGAIYFQTPLKQSTIMNINGLLFQAVANMNFMFQFAAVNVFCDELPIFMREHLANLYRVDAYFLAKNVAEMGQYLLYPFLFASIVYWMAGFVPELVAFLFFALSCIAVTNVAISISYAMACIFATTDVATAVLPILVIPLLAFGGFYINQDSLPFYFKPIKYLSYFGYGYETSSINQWTRVSYIGGCNGTAFPYGEDVGGSGMVSCPSNCCSNGTAVLSGMSFDPGNLLGDYLIMGAMIIVLRTIAFIALLIRSLTKK